ncbi:hypothetical protein [Vibrio splendidus]|uniref:hypothetical protein n=1 Tax=Vibrio splendidus TaxID=29497 RepID=UPI000C8236B9|nr:hypothetical protein [Vibrio splendidus]PMO71084.1 hypothetical protein BCT03_20250 [Vibrio splendidus]
MEKQRFFNFTSTGVLFRSFLLIFSFAVGAILSHFTNLYIVQITVLVLAVLSLWPYIKGGLVVYTSLVVLLCIEYDVSYNIRLWHPIVLALLAYYLLNNVSRMKISIKYFCFFSYFIGISVLWVIFDPFYFSMVNFKQWFFYVGLTFVLFSLSKEKYYEKLLIATIVVFALCFLGIIQYLINVNFGVSGNLLYPNIPNLELRPVALFSETTWLSEFSLIFLVVSWFFFIKSGRKFFLYACFVFCYVVIITNTRNTYVAMLMLFTFSCALSIYTSRVNSKLIRYFTILAIILLIPMIGSGMLTDYFDAIFARFKSIDSSSGRVLAFNLSFEKLGTGINLIFGSGYYWDQTFQAGFGTSIGAKSFNLLLMILHIYGVVGLCLFLLIVTFFILEGMKKCKLYSMDNCRYSLYILVLYLSISMFAPIHQYPAGAFILLLVFIFRYADNERFKW